MEPASILTIVVTSLSVIVKTSTCLKELAQKYRSVGQEITLIIVKLNTMEAIMSQISSWLRSSPSLERQMMSDMNTAVAACEFVVGEIYSHVDRVGGGRIRHMGTEDQLHQYQRNLDSQISALGVLINVAILTSQGRQDTGRGKPLGNAAYEGGPQNHFGETLGSTVECKIGTQSIPDILLDSGDSPPLDFRQELLRSKIYSSAAPQTSTTPAKRPGESEELNTPSSDTTTINTSSGSSLNSSTRSIGSKASFLNNNSRRQLEEREKLSKELHNAVLRSKPALAKSLCSNGADANYRYHNNTKPRDVRSVFGRLLPQSYGCGEPTLLHHAAEKGDQDIARILLAHSADHSARDKSGKTPLHLASDDIAKLLLLHGADPSLKDNKGATPLHYMAAAGRSNAVAALIQTGSNANAYDKIQQTPLHLACIGGHRKVVSLLVEAGAYVKMVDADGLTPLHAAAKHGHDRIIRGLLRAGTDPEAPSKRGWRPIHYAAACGGSIKAIESLLAAQVDVDSQIPGGQTGLHLAIVNGQQDAVELFLERGADSERIDERGNTPLFLAVASMRSDILSILLRHGVQADAAKANGDTALLEACCSQASAQTTSTMVQLLLENGSRVNQKLAAHTPLQAACSRAEGGLLVVQMLLSYGARVRYEDYVCLWRNRDILTWEKGAIKAELDAYAPDELKKDEVEWVMIAL